MIAAQRALVEELLKLAGNDSPLAGLAPDEVGCRDGGLCDLDAPDRCESYASILGRAKRDEVTVQAAASTPEETQKWSMHSFGAMFCEARVNAVTGETRISRFLGSFDCGRIINAKTAASQFRGGIIMGLGLALTEETQFDERNGRIMNPSLAEYHVPVHMDVPDDRGDVDRHPRSAHADGRARHRRDRHHRRRRRGRQRDLQRDGQTPARSADDARQGAGRRRRDVTFVTSPV